MNRLLVLGAFVVAAVVAILVLFDTGALGVLDAIGWLAVAACLYCASALVP